MRIQVRGWNRNHGWRQVFQSRLLDATHSVGDGPVPHEGVNIETSDRPYVSPGGGIANLYFRVNLTQPLNGEYMFQLTLSKKDILRIVKLTILEATVGQILALFGMLSGPTPSVEMTE